MGDCESSTKDKIIQVPKKDIKNDELYPINGFKRIPLRLIKSICKINTRESMGTGFFLNSLSHNKYLLTNTHVINRDMLTSYFNVNIEIYNGMNFVLNLKKIHEKNWEDIKFYEKPIDITIVKINDLKEIFNYIEFLDIEHNNKKDYNNYQYENVFTFGYPLGKDIECSPGKIISISDIEFEHNCDTEQGFSGSPIILASNSKVIGIHKQGIIDKKLNVGTFLGKIDELKYNINKGFNIIDKMNIKIFQIEKSICKIETERCTGVGFLCLIEDSDKNLSIPTLFASGHVLNKSVFEKEIKLIFYNKEKKMKLDKSRILFSDEKISLIIIKMKENEYDIDDYLKIDENIYKEKEIYKLYKGKKIYHISFGEIGHGINDGRLMNFEENYFIHSCSSSNNSIGGPILNSDNMKVIGIHIGIDRNKSLGIGIIIPKNIKQNAFKS